MKVFETIATNQTISAPQQAQRYFDAGMCPVPNKPRTKEPVESGWPTTRFSRDDLATKFQEGTNIGIILGPLISYSADHPSQPVTVSTGCHRRAKRGNSPPTPPA